MITQLNQLNSTLVALTNLIKLIAIVVKRQLIINQTFKSITIKKTIQSKFMFQLSFIVAGSLLVLENSITVITVATLKYVTIQLKTNSIDFHINIMMTKLDKTNILT